MIQGADNHSIVDSSSSPSPGIDGPKLISNDSPDGSLSDKSSTFDDQDLSVPFLVTELGGSA